MHDRRTVIRTLTLWLGFGSRGGLNTKGSVGWTRASQGRDQQDDCDEQDGEGEQRESVKGVRERKQSQRHNHATDRVQ